MSACDDLLNAMQDFVQSGHTFQLSPSRVDGSADVTVNISGPSGSRSALGIDLHHALSDLFTQIALARLAPEPPPHPVNGGTFWQRTIVKRTPSS